jgi:pseudouridine-5'-phosphate glycosidase
MVVACPIPSAAALDAADAEKAVQDALREAKCSAHQHVAERFAGRRTCPGGL